ncbi:SpoIIE family protein phosphatase [Streptomyces sp. LX-29]|uniref:SpoIIE family protein phosphatase n=1 Tax=Streptomyces sp. LX-29 TaxID=2900152 RepID=UPI00240D3FCA|nr:SpoIIE family protein phosphatase [Streptomyces sp. LX-29]WFB08704.1 SpoIIE family protein phosphatase [Streptomyces sp. LX-29]
MNFTRWSARLPGTQRRAAARADRGAGRSASSAPTGGGSVPAARGERADSAHPGAEAPTTAPAGAVDPARLVPTLDGLSVPDVLGHVPALVAVVYGPEHRIAYVNDAYAALFGPRAPGAPAGQALPELRELGLLPLMDQVLRSGKPRTVKSRRVPRGGFPSPHAPCAEAAPDEATEQETRAPRATVDEEPRAAMDAKASGAADREPGTGADQQTTAVHAAEPVEPAPDHAASLTPDRADAADEPGVVRPDKPSAPPGEPPTARDDAPPAGPRAATAIASGRSVIVTGAAMPGKTVIAPACSVRFPRGTARGPVPAAGRRSRDGYYTFTCTPIEVAAPSPTAAAHRGVLIFGADVTDQVEAAERLRASERRQREAAVTLQRSLLPQELEQPDDLRVAATYQPGGTDAAVGGDWYDVITLGAGRTALVIGDVMGRGVRAAAVMGQLRTAVRAYARLDLPPHEVLQLLDGLAAEIDPHQIATCVYAVHDPNEGRLVYASAGHLPILVREPDGSVHRADEPTGPPLGTGGWLHTSGSVPLGPGASAVLYTDGLVERRDMDIDAGVAALEQAFAGATGSPQVMCDRLIRALGITAEHDDDVAVLVLQHPARTGHDAELFHNAALELLGGVEAAPRARAFASGVLASWRFPMELRDLGVLAASELVANSLQHGTPPMRLRLRRTDRRLIIEVTDGDDHLPRRRRAEPVDEAGRGISIVATIASSWGSRRTPGGGKAVWCEFALPEG